MRAEIVAATSGIQIAVVEGVIECPGTRSTIEGELESLVLRRRVGGHSGRNHTAIFVDGNSVTVVRLLVAHDKGLPFVVIAHQDVLTRLKLGSRVDHGVGRLCDATHRKEQHGH